MFELVKKMMIVVACSFSLLLVSGSIVQAEDGYCTGVNVIQAGSKVKDSTAVNSVLLENTRSCGNWPVAPASGSKLWFNLDPINQDAMLATALTSMSLAEGTVTVISKGGNTYTNWGTLIHLSASPN